MRDRDIARQLQRSEGGSTFGSLFILLGLSCIGISIAWRLLRAAVAFAA